MTASDKTLTAVCPSCAVRIHFNKKPGLGDIIVCHECEETLEVVRLVPLKVDWSLLDDDESWADIDTEASKDNYDRSDRYERD
jgi:lysine biosynthesis protein LysW